MLIDMHAHVIPDAFPPAGNRESADRWPRWEAAESPNMRSLVMGEGRAFPATDFYYSVDARLRAMEANKVDAEVVSPMPTLLNYTYPIADALDLCRATNEYIVRLCETDKRRFYGVGNLPMQDPEASAKELAGIKQMGLYGVELASNIRGVSLGDERFLGFFQEAERQGLAVFVHALHPTVADRVSGAQMNAIGFPTDTGMTIASMIGGGTAAKCPDLRIAFSHGGGTFPFMLPRYNNAWSGTWNEEPQAGDRGAGLRQAMPHSPAELARRFYYDTLLFDRRAVRYLIDIMGHTQVLVGTDYPYQPPEQPADKTLRSLGLPQPVHDDITWHNCFRFLGVAAPAAVR